MGWDGRASILWPWSYAGRGGRQTGAEEPQLWLWELEETHPLLSPVFHPQNARIPDAILKFQHSVLLNGHELTTNWQQVYFHQTCVFPPSEHNLTTHLCQWIPTIFFFFVRPVACNSVADRLTNFDLFFPCSYLIIYLLALKLSFSHLNFKTGASGGAGQKGL